MGVDNSLLSVDFNETNEYFAILNKRIEKYKELIEEIEGKCDKCDCDEEDKTSINLVDHISNCKTLLKQINVFSTKNTDINNMILIQYSAASMAYSKILLNPEMIEEALNNVEKPDFDNISSVNEIYKVKKLDFVSIDGDIVCNKSQDGLAEVEEEFLNQSVSVEMTNEDFAEIIEGIGIFSDEEKEQITNATLTGTISQGVLDILAARGIKINILDNGLISIYGSNEKVTSFLGGNIRRCKPTTLVGEIFNGTKQSAKSCFDFGAGLPKGASFCQRSMAKVNSALMYANIINNVDDAYQNYKITGNIKESLLGLGIDVGVTIGSAYVAGAASSVVVGTLTIGSGGSVWIAIGIGTVIAYFYNKHGAKVKEKVFDTIDDLEDYIRNQKDPDLCIN